jgi:Arm DNA-binding domain
VGLLPLPLRCPVPLTDVTVRIARARERAYKLSDGAGLCLLVQPNGKKWWRFRYKWNGREQMLSMGVYPDISLLQLANDAMTRGGSSRATSIWFDPSTAHQ